MNRVSVEILGWRTPLETLKGYTPDIIMIYRFKFWDKVYFKRGLQEGKSFPSKSNEDVGRFVGFSEKVGHTMTYKILTSKTNKIIYRSRIKLSSIQENKRAEDTIGDLDVVKSRKGRPIPIIDPTTLIGKYYYSESDEMGREN